MTKEQKQRKMAYDDKWQTENVERITIKPRKDERITERIELATAETKVSRQAYIIAAIREKLERDGIPEIANDSDKC